MILILTAIAGPLCVPVGAFIAAAIWRIKYGEWPRV